ncbi:hypothetical protein CICLE_v10029738mg [Citrus x clementina]|uniref:Uncharacterized protein n=1 Tax=Citrus clementina TaxID=85681 RepID=V4RRD3_CITCL|nr:hypothetical protein CICLE_v10029738mg [Citrus x clementina]
MSRSIGRNRRIREGKNAFQEALFNFFVTSAGWKKQEDIYLLEKKLKKEQTYSFYKSSNELCSSLSYSIKRKMTS